MDRQVFSTTMAFPKSESFFFDVLIACYQACANFIFSDLGTISFKGQNNRTIQSHFC